MSDEWIIYDDYNDLNDEKFKEFREWFSKNILPHFKIIYSEDGKRSFSWYEHSKK